MKKLVLVIAGLLVLGATSLVADSEVEVAESLVVGLAVDSEIDNSTLGLAIDATDSEVSVEKSLIVGLAVDSEVTDSTLGVSIKAK